MAVYEDFNRYTEYDPNGTVVPSFNSISVTGLQRTDTAYVRQDYGTPGQFTNTLSHNFEFNVSSMNANGLADIWMITTEASNNTHEKAYQNQDGLCIYIFNNRLYLRPFETGGGPTLYAISMNTTYYCTVSRSGTTITLQIYSDSARTALLSTLTRTCTAKTYRYIYAMASRGLTGADQITYSSENYDLGVPWTNQTSCELGGCYWWANSCHEGPMFPFDDLASGYLAQFQNTVIKGINSTSGDYRTIEVNASGHVYVDVEIDVSSGLHVVQESGAFVQISGQHVYVESGVWIAGLSFSGLDIEVSVSGDPVDISGGHVYVESGVYAASGIMDGIATVIKTDAVRVITADSGGEVLHSGPILSMTVKALAANTSDIYLGGVAPCRPYSGFGFAIGGGEAKSYDVNNFDACYLCATTSGDKVTFDGIN